MIGCFSSLPTSNNDVIKKMLDSLENQTVKLDRIYWFYPYYSKRIKKNYDPPPKWVSEYKNLIVHRCEDKGPLTKVSPILDIIKNPDSGIVVFDDDAIYNPKSIELLKNNYTGKEAICFRGHTYKYIPFIWKGGTGFDNKKEWYNRVNIILGMSMYVVPRKIFPDTEKELLNLLEKYKKKYKNIHIHDDHFISSLINKKNVPMYALNLKHKQDTQPNLSDRINNNTWSSGLEMEMILKGELPFLWCETVFIIFIIFIIYVIYYELKT